MAYQKAAMNLWHGRIDDENDYDSFRWHQHIKEFNFNNIKPAKTLSFVLIGYCIDEGIRLNKGRVGAAKGPDKVREFLCNKACSFNESVNLYDGGNITLSIDVAAAQSELADYVKLCLVNKYFPIVIGGGHDVAYGSMSGILKYLDIKTNNLGLINFDAHFDLREASTATSGTMFNQIYQDIKRKNGKFNHYTIGIQKSANTKSLFNYADSINSKYLLASDLKEERKILNNHLLDTFTNNQDNLYLTVCSDVFAAPYAPGVSSVQTLGINPEIFLELFKNILNTKKVIAFDIAEIAPPLDSSNTTASLGALIIYTLVNHLASIEYPEY